MVYQWLVEMCPTAKYVLKADDDTFIDTYHLRYFLDRYQFDRKEFFLLCFVMKGNKPRRSEADKYFVTKEEYEEDEYPLHCSGAAYVTRIKTMERILAKLQTLDYLFIDDIFVTGIAAQGIISKYDW